MFLVALLIEEGSREIADGDLALLVMVLVPAALTQVPRVRFFTPVLSHY